MLNFPRTDFDDAVIDCLNSATGMVKNCANSALMHIDKAWALKDIDKEMSLFRAITAEEEIATAIFIALKNLQYNAASKLQHRSHPYKQGLYPFLEAIWQHLNPANSSDVRVHLYVVEENKEKWLRLKFLLTDELDLTPNPPLYQVAMANGAQHYSFKEELDRFAENKGESTISHYIRELALLRNSILYAHSGGGPDFQGDVKRELSDRLQRVLHLLRVLSLIFPYKKHSPLVQQCIHIYLGIMEGIESPNHGTESVGNT